MADMLREWEAPSMAHPFGLGENGGDLLRLCGEALYNSLKIAITVSAMGLLVGVLLSSLVFFVGGLRADRRYFYLLNFLESFPALILYLAIGLYVRQSFWAFAVLLTSLGWVHYARYTRNFIREFYNRDFVLAAQALGYKPLQILRRQLLPHFGERYAILFVSGCRYVILAESLLSFLGFGLSAGHSQSLGTLLHLGQRVMFRHPHGVWAPALTLAFLLFLLNALFARFQTVFLSARSG
jgi:ABC-type dipeptide/oligopeptide/nickel transport system permease subunit